jgi:hypothetical protein
MDAVEILALQQPLVAAHVPGDMARLSHNLFVIGGCDKPLFLLLEIPLVIERQ